MSTFFRILGPLEITADGVSVPLNGARQRTIMSMLLLSPDRVVSVDTLADAVWDGAPPPTARNQIAICVSAMRKIFRTALGPADVIVTRHPGYLLAADGHRIDALEFRAAVARGREDARQGSPEQAAAAYESALGLWRGDALGGIEASRVASRAARLNESRVEAYLEYTALRLELGRHEDLLGELTAFVREHPLNEQANAHLMLAQYRSGRRADALETYRAGRRELTESAGIEPGPRLRDLHQAILRDAPELALTPVREPEPADPPPRHLVPAELPAPTVSFTGRERELAALDGLLAHQDAGGPSVGAVTGIGGVGKTALAVHWAHRVADRFPDGVLFADLYGYHEDEAPRRATEVLDGFLRALGLPAQDIPAGEEERARLLRTVLKDRRVLIVLDNARSFEQIRPLLPGSGRCCVLLTGRDVLSEPAGAYTFVAVPLGSLPHRDAAALLGRVAGAGRVDADPAATSRLVELCDGLPLALRIAGARLAGKPHWTVRTAVVRLADHRRRLDELSPDERGVRACLRLSYRALDADAARLLRLLATLEVPAFSAWAGAALLEVDVIEAEDLFEQLVDAQMLEPAGAGPEGQMRYSFQQLVRLFVRERALLDDTEAERAAAVRRACGVWLWLASAAHRRLYGGDYTLIHGPAPRYPLPEDVADQILHDPMAWFERERTALTGLIEQACAQGESAYAWDLTLTTVTLFQNREYPENWRHCADAAWRTAQRAGDAVGEAAMLHSLATLDIIEWHLDTARDRLTAALRLFEERGENAGRALALRNLALCERQLGDHAAAAVAGRRSLELFRAAGDRYAEAHVLVLLAQIELERGDPKRSLELSADAVVRSQTLGATRVQAQGIVRRAEAYVLLGDGARAEDAAREAVRLVRADRDRRGEAHALRALGAALWCRGNTREAEDVLRDGVFAARLVPDRFLEARAATALSCVLAQLTWRGEAAEWAALAGRLFAEVGADRWEAVARRLAAAVQDDRPAADLLFALAMP
ncbi:Regulatory protein AfsR [Streptomyces sp. RB5]|uniref:Regulatory protein AfsR n=1 Tax=Streptomyces smaragdinus TaxID=2585196 RepID=A0A7K0CD95_9ACTN|nr:BTAD domain-containing putative transcriptional regulator [Streptomyces smaragdinus]MQY11313.1 Regulatory protein AfsR [Streptomyces smaragdinus]